MRRELLRGAMLGGVGFSLAVACGGESDSTPGGVGDTAGKAGRAGASAAGAAGRGSSGAAGRGTGGTANGGTANGGTANGGSTAGTATSAAGVAGEEPGQGGVGGDATGGADPGGSSGEGGTSGDGGSAATAGGGQTAGTSGSAGVSGSSGAGGAPAAGGTSSGAAGFSGSSGGSTAGGGATAGGSAGTDGSLAGAGGGIGSSTVTAYRFTQLALRDPHTFVSFIGCHDVTDTALAGSFSTNGELATRLTTDQDDDGYLDFSPTVVFRALDQAATSQPIELHYAACTAPLGTTACRATASVVSTVATNAAAGSCLSALPGTVRPYSPSVTSTGAPCFVTEPVTLPIQFAGVPMTLHAARIAATYEGSPAASLSGGILYGFLTQADADATLLPESYPLVGGRPLSTLLPGGDRPPAGGTDQACASHSDKDVADGVAGWWFYFAFSAAKVAWSEP